MQTIFLLTISNIFMTMAWYGWLAPLFRKIIDKSDREGS